MKDYSHIWATREPVEVLTVDADTFISYRTKLVADFEKAHPVDRRTGRRSKAFWEYLEDEAKGPDVEKLGNTAAESWSHKACGQCAACVARQRVDTEAETLAQEIHAERGLLAPVDPRDPASATPAHVAHNAKRARHGQLMASMKATKGDCAAPKWRPD